MEVFVRHSIYSNFEYVSPSEINLRPHIISIGMIDETSCVVEYISDADWDKYVEDKKTNPTTQKDNVSKLIPPDVKKALAIKLNEDPFYMGCSGLTLEEIYKNHNDWVEKARNDLKNQYIRGKMEIIDNYIADCRG